MSRRLALLALVGGLALAAAHAAGAAETYIDPTGDATAGAPDLTTITVENDAAGTVVFTITLANQPELAADSLIDLGIDADRAVSTGGSDGADFHIVVYGDTKTFSFFAWTSTGFVGTTGPSVEVRTSANSLRISVNRSDLNGTAAFDFYVVGVQLSGESVVGEDDAPELPGVYLYTLTTPPPPPPPTVGLGAPSAKPPGIRAGRPFVVSGRVSTNARTIKVTCSVRLGVRPVRSVARYAAGRAACAGIVPVGSAGKRLTVAIGVTVPGDRDARTASFLIRR